MLRTLMAIGATIVAFTPLACSESHSSPPGDPNPDLALLGRDIFRHDTFGDEVQWTDTLRLHEVVETLTPTTALALGLKVDSEAIPAEVLASADLEDPATTVALIELNAVIGVHGVVENGHITQIGVTCALCHSNVDDSVAPGIGRRLDGWANTDLDVGRILAATPPMQDPAIQAELLSWGPGKYDARFNQDGISDPTVIPPAYGLAGTDLVTYTGDGDIAYWNAYVAVTQMGGQGVFEDPRIGVSIEHSPDRVTSKLDALRAYQHSLATPPPPPGSFDPVQAARGRTVFEGAAGCANCHREPNFTVSTLLPPGAIGTDPTHAARSATGAYRVTPLRALWQHPPYFHDGSAATLEAVIEHYEAQFGLNLTPGEKADLAEYLRSI